VLAAFPPPRQFVKADRRNRAEQGDSGDDRQEERHQRPVGRHHNRRNSEQRVNQAGEQNVAAHRLEIVEPLAQREAQVMVVDFADGDWLGPDRGPVG